MNDEYYSAKAESLFECVEDIKQNLLKPYVLHEVANGSIIEDSEKGLFFAYSDTGVFLGFFLSKDQAANRIYSELKNSQNMKIKMEKLAEEKTEKEPPMPQG